MSEAYLGLGSNLGDKQAYLRSALKSLEPNCRVLAVSSFYATEPVGYREQDWFLNCAAKVETDLTPRELLRFLKSIEAQLGRQPAVANGPRTIDIDVLLFDDLTVDEDGITIPHPRMHERLFVLAPLNEIAADRIHPTLAKTIRELLNSVTREYHVKRA